MIVLDESISGHVVIDEIKAWHKGKVTSINKLRLTTVVKDDGIPTILQTPDLHHHERLGFLGKDAGASGLLHHLL